MMRATGEFCGVEVLTYCLLDSHWHALVRVPEKSAADSRLTDAELVRRFRALYPRPTRHQPVSPEQLERMLADGGERAKHWRRKLTRRMHELSEFTKTVKQRFSVWYNRTHGRFGTLWAERFTSVLIEGAPGGAPTGILNAAAVCAAYIDLNPVRAGIVDDPKDYRFCGYAEAESGGREARRGIASVLLGRKGNQSAAKAMRHYRSLLFGKGSAPAPGKGGNAATIDPDKARQVIAEGGRLPLHVLLRLRVRYFTEGAVLGSRAFLEAYFSENRNRFGPRRRREAGARQMPGGLWGDLAVLNVPRDHRSEQSKATA